MTKSELISFQPSTLALNLNARGLEEKNVEELWEWMKIAERSIPENTLKAYIYDWKIFQGWCYEPIIPWSNYYGAGETRTQKARYGQGDDRNLKEYYGDTVCPLPADWSTIRDFIEAKVGFIAPATLTRIISTIAKIHQVAMLPDPTVNHKVKLVMKRIGGGLTKKQKQFGCPHHNTWNQDQAKPMRFFMLNKLRKLPDWSIKKEYFIQGVSLENKTEIQLKSAHALTNVRNLALLFLAYDAQLRSEEVAYIERHQISFDDSKGTGVLRLGKTKTNQSGVTTYHFIAPDTCELLKQWINEANIETGPLFCTLTKWGTTRKDKDSGWQKAMTERAILDVYYKASLDLGIGKIVEKKMLDKEGKVKKDGQGNARYSKTHKDCWSTHSARIGCLLDLRQIGTPMIEMMQAGRWKSQDMILRYTKQYDIQEGGTANLAMVQKRTKEADFDSHSLESKFNDAA